MKSALSLALSLALVGAGLFAQAYAGNEATRLLAMQQLEAIQSRTENLTNAINNWDQDGKDDIGTALTTATNNIHYPSADLVSFINNATEALKQVPTTFDLTQSFVIGTPTQRLAYAVNHSVAALNVKLPSFYKWQIQSVVTSDLEDLLYASNNYSQVLLGYVPANIRPVANALNEQIIDSLTMGQNCFSKNNTASPDCATYMVNATQTWQLALQYGAIKPNGYPIA